MEADDAEMDDEYPAKFVEKQSAVSQQIEALLLQIREKEKLVQQTATNFERMDGMRVQHEVCCANAKRHFDRVIF